MALVTGANRGLGLKIARQLGQGGMTVLMEARDEAKGVKAAKTLYGKNLDVQFIPLDVTDQTTVQAAIGKVTDR